MQKQQNTIERLENEKGISCQKKEKNRHLNKTRKLTLTYDKNILNRKEQQRINI